MMASSINSGDYSRQIDESVIYFDDSETNQSQITISKQSTFSVQQESCDTKHSRSAPTLKIEYPIRLDFIERGLFESFFTKYDDQNLSHYIPCMYLPFTLGSSKLLIYFHANAEDIAVAYKLLASVRTLLRVNVLAIEYPGYSFYTELFQKVRPKDKKKKKPGYKTNKSQSTSVAARSFSCRQAFNANNYNVQTA